MATQGVNTNINIPQGPFLDPNTGRPSTPWLLWLQNPNQVGATYSNPLGVTSGGTSVSQSPTAGQILIGGNGNYQLGNIQSGNGVTVVNGDGTITIDSSAVLNVSGGTTGFAFAENGGQSTMYGILNSRNGGTGYGSYSEGDILYANASGILSKLAKPASTSYLQMNSLGVPSWAAGATGVNSFSAGTTGFTPSTGTGGNVTLAGTLNATSGGTGLTTYVTGDILYSNASNTLTTLSKPAATSFLSMDNTGTPTWSTSLVTSFSAGTTGLTPSTPTTGAIVLAGVLAIANGGTGTSTAGATGTFLSGDVVQKTITVVNGFITSIV